MNDKDEWETPQDLYTDLNEIFTFDVDLCATKYNHKTCNFVEDLLHETAVDFAFMADHGVSCAFMNPPYSNIGPFLEKAWEASRFFKVVCLVPNTIKTCKYMDFLDENNGVYYLRRWKAGVEFRDLSRRTKFTHPRLAPSSPNFGCMLIIFDRLSEIHNEYIIR